MASTTDSTNTAEQNQSSVIFDPPLIEQTGDIGEVLVDLMNNQTRKIQQEIHQEFEEEKLPENTLRRILGRFISLEGTKQPRQIEALQFPEIPESVTARVVKKLVDARLLRESEDGVYELVHDTLAAHLHQNRDPEEIAVDVAVKIVKDAYFSKDTTDRYLSAAELAQFENHSEIIKSTNRLTEEEWAFVSKSKRKARRRTLITYGLLALAIAVAVVMSGLYLYAQNVARYNEALLEENGIFLEDFKKNNELTQQTAKALQNSKNDRTNAFLSLQAIQDSIDEDVSNQELVDQLTNEFLSEFSLFPFYKRGEKFTDNDTETIDEVIVEDSLKFVLGSVKDSPVAFLKTMGSNKQQFKSSIADNGKGFLVDPGKFSEYGKITDMVLLPDGLTVLTGHADLKIWKWNISSDDDPELVYQFDTTTSKHRHIREMILAESHQLLVGVDSLIYEIDLRKKKPLARFRIGFNRSINLLVANPKVPGQYAVVKENSPKIFLCNTRHDSIETEYYQSLSTVTSLAFSPDGKKMIAAYEEGELAKLWALNRPQIITEFKGHRALISSIAFSKDGRQIITGSWDQTAILWTNKGRIIKRLVGHNMRIQSVAYTKNDFAVTCDEEGNFKTWFLGTLAERERIFKDSIRAMAVSPKHETIAFSLFGDKGFFYLWDWRRDTLETIQQPIKKYDQKGDIVALAYTEDGKNIVAASENTLTTFIDLSGNNRHEDYRGGGAANIPRTSSISAVDVNEEYILIADRRSNQVLLRSRKDPGKYIALPHDSRVQAAKFSPDNRFVLSGCDDGKGYLWDISVNPPVRRLLQGHSSKVVAVDFSHDGRYLLTGSYDNTANLYELSENERGNLSPIHKLEGIRADYRGHTSDINAVAFAHSAKDNIYHFTTGSADKSGKFWKFEKGRIQELPSVIQHLDEVTVAGFLPGDSLIVTGSFDETIKVWRAGQVEELIRERILN